MNNLFVPNVPDLPVLPVPDLPMLSTTTLLDPAVNIPTLEVPVLVLALPMVPAALPVVPAVQLSCRAPTPALPAALRDLLTRALPPAPPKVPDCLTVAPPPLVEGEEELELDPRGFPCLPLTQVQHHQS